MKLTKSGFLPGPLSKFILLMRCLIRVCNVIAIKHILSVLKVEDINRPKAVVLNLKHVNASEENRYSSEYSVPVIERNNLFQYIKFI